MAIIMVDCDDCYERANKFGEISRKFSMYADMLGQQGEALTAALREYSQKFETLREDINASTDIWADFYAHNVRLD